MYFILTLIDTYQSLFYINVYLPWFSVDWICFLQQVTQTERSLVLEKAAGKSKLPRCKVVNFSSKSLLSKARQFWQKWGFQSFKRKCPLLNGSLMRCNFHALTTEITYKRLIKMWNTNITYLLGIRPPQGRPLHVPLSGPLQRPRNAKGRRWR